jgi:hypothetical protein
MKDNIELIELLLARVVEYSKTSFELLKLKALEKSSDVISSLAVHSIIVFLIASFMFFLNLGLAFWLGEILGNTCYGFFVVGAFYGFIGIILHLFLLKNVKNILRNYVIRQLLK